MKYAVVKAGGRQYKVSEGDTIEIDLQKDAEANSQFTFSEVLLFVSDTQTIIGTPTIPNFSVVGKVFGAVKGEKIRVAKFKAKARSRRVIGYRHSLTRIVIETVGKETKGTKETQETRVVKTKTPRKKKQV
ncbi:MAG: 50S ribosomal protein L21 [Patescibacteria group bacterium]